MSAEDAKLSRQLELADNQMDEIWKEWMAVRLSHGEGSSEARMLREDWHEARGIMEEIYANLVRERSRPMEAGPRHRVRRKA